MNTPQTIDRTYFDRAAADQRPHGDLFAATAQVRDDGGVYDGTEAIRAWRSSVPAVSYDVPETTHDGSTITSSAAVSGEFPGSPVTLTFRFELDDDGLIRSLEIHP